MPRQQLVVHLAAASVARVEALLELAGAESIALSDAADDPVLEPDPGRTPLWPEVSLRAVFAEDADAGAIAAWLVGALPDAAPVELETVDEQAWRARGSSHSQPLLIGRRLAVVPADARAKPEGRIVLRLNMGLAFGTGEHPTTRLCLEWLERELVPGGTLVDYGCGSGVLAIAGLALGARRALATDNDPQALAATADNAVLNDVADRLWTGPPEALETQPVDVLVANILARPLAALAPRFARLVATGGHIVLTGILEPQIDDVISAYAMHFEPFERCSSDGWWLLAARRAKDRHAHP